LGLKGLVVVVVVVVICCEFFPVCDIGAGPLSRMLDFTPYLVDSFGFSFRFSSSISYFLLFQL
jgi:hypothetical protein